MGQCQDASNLHPRVYRPRVQPAQALKQPATLGGANHPTRIRVHLFPSTVLLDHNLMKLNEAYDPSLRYPINTSSQSHDAIGSHHG